jgi:uncharacterized protein (DUF2235 family)
LKGQRDMTRIAIFCDGTWNSPDIPETTNVLKLQSAVRHAPEAGQVSVYFPGIGTDNRFDGPVKSFVRRWGGGAFGWGLDEKVKQAYQFIAQAYRDGDEIYLFGFSRGAYTARSVAGMIRKCGLVRDTSADGINAAWTLYRKRGRRNHPDAPRILRQRRELSPDFATSQRDLEWRSDGSHLVNIAYVGVWDTVGARGVPVALLGPLAAVWNAQYKFHDMALSSLVRSARHAVALDERRVFYTPTLWDNLDGPGGLNGGRDDAPDRPYQQVWFVGTHSVVGGSSTTQALAAYTLLWIFEGAKDLQLDSAAIFPPTPPSAVCEAPEISPDGRWFKKWRKGPRLRYEAHPSVFERYDADDGYRPGSLRLLS